MNDKIKGFVYNQESGAFYVEFVDGRDWFCNWIPPLLADLVIREYEKQQQLSVPS